MLGLMTPLRLGASLTLVAVLLACSSTSSSGGSSDGGLMGDRRAGSSSGSIGDAGGTCGVTLPASCEMCVASMCCSVAQQCGNTAGCPDDISCVVACFGTAPDGSVSLTCVSDCVAQGSPSAQYYAQQVVNCMLACRAGGSGC
jgi:hypothetical protein